MAHRTAIKEVAKAQGWTLTRLAWAVGLSRENLSRKASGKLRLDRYEAIKIAGVLDVPLMAMIPALRGEAVEQPQYERRAGRKK